MADALVFDNGSGVFKAGFAGDDIPRAVFPTVIGCLKPGTTTGISCERPAVGDHALARSHIYNLKYPIQNGIITNFDNMEALWHFTFYNELCVAPEEHAILLTEHPLNPKVNKEKMAEIMFETFHVPAMYVAIPAVLSLYSYGLLSGIALDSGEAVSSAVPVYEGFAIRHAINSVNIAGRDVSDYLLNILTHRGYAFTHVDPLIFNDAKEKLAYIASDFVHEMKTGDLDKTYTLPDGQVITLGNERFRCAEALFQPSFLGLNTPGLHEITYKSIAACNESLQMELKHNVILCGGNTKLPGMSERLSKELTILASSNITIVRQPERKHLSWEGGSILASLSAFEEMCISKNEYEEDGPAILHMKCT